MCVNACNVNLRPAGCGHCTVRCLPLGGEGEEGQAMNAEEKEKDEPLMVIRCRDCKYFSSEAIGEYHLCHKGGYFKEDGYCSRAERRGEQEDEKERYSLYSKRESSSK